MNGEGDRFALVKKIHYKPKSSPSLGEPRQRFRLTDFTAPRWSYALADV